MVGTMTAIFRKKKNSKHGKQLLGGNTGKKGRGRRQSSVERVLDKVMVRALCRFWRRGLSQMRDSIPFVSLTHPPTLIFPFILSPEFWG